MNNGDPLIFLCELGLLEDRVRMFFLNIGRSIMVVLRGNMGIRRGCCKLDVASI